MAQKVEVTLIDDLDGKKADETVRLMRNGVLPCQTPCTQRPRVRYDFGSLKSMVTAGGVGAASAYIAFVAGRAVGIG